MIIHDVPQRSAEWFAARLGMFTASSAGKMLATVKSGEAAGRTDLRVRLVLERITGQPQEEGYVNAAMQRGVDKESDALAAYEALTGNVAMPCGFFAHDTLKAGCSPDGIVGEYEGVLELKCPKSSTHLSYLRSRSIPKDYAAQMTHAMWITGAQWADFLSFDDRFPAELQVFYARLVRKETEIAAYEIMAKSFLKEVEQEVKAVTELAAGVAA